MGSVNKAGKVGNYAEAISREFHSPVKVHLARGRTGIDRTSAANIIVAVPCSSGHEVEVGLNQMFPPEVIRKKMTQAGWDFHHGPLCPSCVDKAKAEKRRSKPVLALVPPAPPIEQDVEPQPQVPEKEVTMDTSIKTGASSMAIAAATAPDLTPSAKAKAARREVMQWLDESFELTGAEKGRYKAGVTDASIAKETGCSEDAVKKIREDFYGALDRPKALDTIMAEVDSLKAAANLIITETEAAVNAMMDETKAKAKALHDKADKLKYRFEQISREQGWGA